MIYPENRVEYFRNWIDKLTSTTSSVMLLPENIELEIGSSFKEEDKQRFIKNYRHTSSWC